MVAPSSTLWATTNLVIFSVCSSLGVVFGLLLFRLTCAVLAVHGGAADGKAELQWNSSCQAKRRRLKEQELFLDNSQITSVDFLQAAGSVSTGLGLSLDDRRVASSSGDSPILVSSVDDEVEREIQRQDVEMDRFVKLQVSI